MEYYERNVHARPNPAVGSGFRREPGSCCRVEEARRINGDFIADAIVPLHNPPERSLYLISYTQELAERPDHESLAPHETRHALTTLSCSRHTDGAAGLRAYPGSNPGSTYPHHVIGREGNAGACHFPYHTPDKMIMKKEALKTNEILRTGDYLVSYNGAFYAVLQKDGNLSVYAGTGPSDQREWVWSALSVSQPLGEYFAIMQGDGNLCVYRGTGPGDNHGLVWQTGPAVAGSGGDFFAVVSVSAELTVYASQYPPKRESPMVSWKASSFRHAPFTLKEVDELIHKYGPLLYFHPHEQYLMSSVEWYLKQCTLHDDKTGRKKVGVDPSDLPTGPREDDRFWLEVPDAAKRGNPDIAPAYVHVKHDITNNYTDLQFWLFSAYNGPGTAFLKSWVFGIEASRGNADLAPLGEHYGDWEYVSLRIDHTFKQVQSVFFSQHGGGQRVGNPEVEHHNNQVVVYVSRNGHANYPKASENFTEYRSYGEKAIGTYIEFMLRNDTGTGRTFDCSRQYVVVAADCIEPKSPEPKWLDYQYRWGPVSATTHITVATIREILKAAFGVLSIVMRFTFLEQLAELLLPIFVKDDKNGIVGPKQHAGSWNGNE